MKEHLVKYVRYNLWANAKVCDFILHLKPGEAEKEITSSFSSIKKTLCHVWGAQQVWLNRLHGFSPTSLPMQDFKGSIEEATNGMLHTSEELIEFTEEINEEMLRSILHYKTLDGKEYSSFVSEVIQHVVNHSTFHRGQLITMFRQLGYTKLFVTDYIAWSRE